MLLARMPSLFSFLPMVKPAAPRSTTNAVMPRCPASGFALANTMNTPASCALVIHSFRPVSDQPVAARRRARGQGEGVAAGSRLRQRVRADRVGGEPREIALPEIGRAPAQQRVHDQRVLDVNQHGHRGVHAGQRLHGEHGVEEARAAPAELFRRLDAHDAERKQTVNQRPRHGGLLVHVAHRGPDFPVGKFVNALPEEAFVLRKRGQRRLGHATDVSTGNDRRAGWKRLRYGV